MLRPLALGLLIGGLAIVSGTPFQTATLKGGVARVEITPQIGLPMYGYRSRSSPSQGVLDPLYARVLALEAGETRLAIVTLDLGQIFANHWLDRLREAVHKSSRVSYVLVAASHTHSGPAPQGDCPSKPVPAWETAALDNIAKAIDEAFQHVVP